MTNIFYIDIKELTSIKNISICLFFKFIDVKLNAFLKKLNS